MDLMLNNGTMAYNVKPDELKRLEELGMVGKKPTADNAAANVVTEEVNRKANPLF